MATASDKLAVKGLLLDMDGVLYVGDEVIDGAVETLDRLRAADVPLRFITNTTTRTPESLVQKLEKIGLPVQRDELFTAVSATIRYLENKGRPSCYLLLDEQVKPLFANFPEDVHCPDFVVVGDIGATWDYETLNEVFNMLMRGSKLICMHRNKFWQVKDGLRMDIGAFVAALEYVSGKEALVIGKPSPAFFQTAVQSLGCAPGEVAIVGDDIDSDIGGGQASGLFGILVQTGKYREDYVARSPHSPDRLIRSVATLDQVVATG